MVDFYANVAVLAVLGIALAVSLYVLIGENGIFSAAQGVFYGIGAYAAALISLHLTSSFFIAVLAAAVTGAVLGLIFSIPALRVHGDYFVIISISFSIIVIGVLSEWASVTGGSGGLIGIMPATLFGKTVIGVWGYLFIALGVLVVTVGVCYFLTRRAPLGRMMRAVGDDSIAAESLGISPVAVRMISVVIASALAAVAGSVYSFYIQYVDPSSFDLNQSVLLVTMVVLGGARNILGPILGGALLGFGVPSLSLLPLAPSVTGPLEQILIGVVLVGAMIWTPNGLITLFGRRPGRSRSATPADGPTPADDRGHGGDGGDFGGSPPEKRTQRSVHVPNDGDMK